MPAYRLWFSRAAAVAFIVIAALACSAQHAGSTSASTVIEDLGKGTVALSGPWRFHTGDDPAWAQPGFNDSGWERLSGDRPWGAQGHERYTGYAWYRIHLRLTPAAGLPMRFSLLIESIDDAYQVYWNGALVGQNGRLKPFRVWYYSQPPQTYFLGGAGSGVLAVRVWKAPLFSDDSGQRGGFETAPLIGSPEAIALSSAAIDYRWLRSRQCQFGENLIYALVAVLGFLAWWRNRSRWFLFWMASYAIVPPLLLLLLHANIRWPYFLAMGAVQPLMVLEDVSLWLVLTWLLLLRENRALCRLTQILACISLTNVTLDGILIGISWGPRWAGAAHITDDISGLIYTLFEAFPLVLVGAAWSRRKLFDKSRWLVAVVAVCDDMVLVIDNMAKQGRQFTNWTLAAKIEAPLFTVGGSGISLRTLTEALLLVAIVYAVYLRLREEEREKAELMRAREQMRQFAEHDGLTGLWNHRIIMERLHGEIDRARREGTQLSVILADIDHFKQINDNFGHPTGDLVLKEVSAVFMESVRSYDWVGRYGGEEFLIILPGSGFEAACQRAEELREAVETAEIVDGDAMLQVTASFGVASGFPFAEAPEDVIRIVDEALYAAKRSGRNRVIATDMTVAADG